MNERIRELYKQARQIPGHEGAVDDPYMADHELRFAELIVLECVNAVMDGTKEGDHYAMRIEKHFDSGNGGILYFGVEE